MINLNKTFTPPVAVKICGIRSEMAAQTAIYSGAKFLGFNFVPTSKRKISPQVAKQIIDPIRRQIKIVGVFQNQKIEEVKKITELLDLDYIQLHGDEDEAYLEELEKPIIKVLQLDADFDITNALKEINKYKADFFILDRKKQGSGKMLNLTHVSVLCKSNSNIFIAGGLTPEIVANVVRNTRPFGVDVAGGIESRSVEDPEKIKRFIERAKSV